ncbi:MAG TPA: glycosyltransferase family 1 protein [Flavitalea sp.]|nr:glycosyltransferase family 1 protein [Flavitalea sp.]
MDIVCFSHLRWDFVYQRPQHLLTRLTPYFRVFYIEETIFNSETDRLDIKASDGLHILRIHVRDEDPSFVKQRSILKKFFIANEMREYLFWFYTPMALPLTKGLKPIMTIFDCMDELSAFKFAPPELRRLEKELLNTADLVFTGGHSLYAIKKHENSNVHSFPSSIDKAHFGKARRIKKQPQDQASIPGPRLGFYGVLDERFDIDLISEIALKKPDWQIVLIGPVVKIDPASLPRFSNIHYLGSKTYQQLPDYLAGWDIAMVSFAMNESTRFISPTKTPEYLSGGKPVISTPIRDVVETYGKNGLVHIINNADEFISVATRELATKDKSSWRRKVDNFLKYESWDITVEKMRVEIYSVLAGKQRKKSRKQLSIYPAKYLTANGSLPAAS